MDMVLILMLLYIPVYLILLVFRGFKTRTGSRMAFVFFVICLLFFFVLVPMTSIS